ncbi:hypothetical protein [Allobranchiibius sp. GilTou38]|uniref:hypothetical protein n=1 Tax=Allobranchiibius sp. GilTou38 TaxID=2815210 RepID=UPI001AA11707|nr:hypothetical protein [Allobranchiibius sp. GilTou38]MBO1765937.1 hypothetical protein [Allobranchiibius sp. GilTou38]
MNGSTSREGCVGSREPPQRQYDAWVSTYTAIASGELAALSPAVQDIAGSAPTLLRDYITAQSHA